MIYHQYIRTSLLNLQESQIPRRAIMKEGCEGYPMEATIKISIRRVH